MIKIVNNYSEANCITHNGTMHADDVFATAFLHLLLENVSVYRVSDVEWDKVLDNTIVYDVGRGEFDHHQKDVLKRENDITYSSIGLLWKRFGKELLEKMNFSNIDMVFSGVDKDLIEAIDADDNGVFPKIEANYKVKTLSNIIKLFNPGFESDEDESEQFIKAVEVAEKILYEELIYINGRVKADIKIREIINNTSSDKKYLILDSFIPYEDTLLSCNEANNILFVAFPSNRGGYAIKTVPKSNEDKSARMLFPEEWAGLGGEEVVRASGIDGLRFCHSARFIVSCDNLETVNKILDLLCK